MSIRDRFPSRYLKANGITPGMIATIDKVVDEVMGEAQEQKPVVYFVELPKPCVLNKTNGLTLADAFGDDETDWGGERVELTVIKVRRPGGGGLIDSISMAKAKPNKKAKPAIAEDEEPDDSIPF